MSLSSPTSEIAPHERYAATVFSECFIDELARAAWRDPVQYRREMLPGTSRLRRVLDEAARISGWSRSLPEGHARGIALSAVAGAVAAHVAEMSVDEGGQSLVHRVVAVIDCGRRAPLESARQRLHDSLLSLWGSAGHAPQLDVSFLDSDAPAGASVDVGSGLAPAMANARATLKVRIDRERMLA